MCDVVHALWVGRIEADVRVAQQTAALISAMGGEPEWPSLDEQVEAFEAWLVSVPELLDKENLELRQALGLRGNGG